MLRLFRHYIPGTLLVVAAVDVAVILGAIGLVSSLTPWMGEGPLWPKAAALSLIVVFALHLADLYDMADNCRPPGRNGATGAVFLLLQAEHDSLAAVRDALKPPANLDDKPSLHDELLGCARDFAVVAPGEAEIAAWGRHLGVP